MQSSEFDQVEFYGFDYGIQCLICQQHFSADNLADLLKEVKEHQHTERAMPPEVSAMGTLIQKVYGPEVCRQLGIEQGPARATS